MKLASFSVGLLCVSAMFVPAQDDGGAAVQSKIVALEKAWNQAYKLGDRHALDGILDDHIVLIYDDGSVQTKAEFSRQRKEDKLQLQFAGTSRSRPNPSAFFSTATLPSPLVYFAPKESRQASPMCGVSAL
jgi:hypothetical protein